MCTYTKMYSLYKCLIINYTIRDAFESPFNIGYTLVIKAMYMWQLNEVQCIEPY